MKRWPLSKAEESMYVSSISGGDAYNLANLIHLGKDTSLGEVNKALKEVLKAHPYLFTVIHLDEEGNLYKTIEEEDVILKLQEVNEVNIVSLSFELLDHHLYRFGLYKKDDEYIFYFDFHHILIDGTSIKIFIDEFLKALEGKSLEKEEYDANDFATDENQNLSSPKYSEDKEYYQKLLDGTEIDSSVIEDKKEDNVSYDLIKADLDIDGKRIREYVKKNNIKTSSFFIGAFNLLISKLNNDNNALTLSVHNGRNDKVRNSLGCYIKTYPVLLTYNDEDEIQNVLKTLNEELIQNVSHNLYPFADLVKDLDIAPNIMFAYQGDYFYSGTFKGKEVEVTPLRRKDGKENMAVELHRLHDQYFVWFEYRSDLYNKESIEQYIHLFEVLINELLEKKYVKDINLIDEKEQALLDKHNEVDLSFFDANRTLLDDFLDVVKKYPDKVGVVYKNKQFTYKQIDEITTRIANELIKLGAGRERVVSILIHKSEFMVLASLAVVKSGSAYQPLDPTYPKDRLNFMVNDSKAVILIRDDDLDDLIDDFKGGVLLTSKLLELKDNTPIKYDVKPDDLFIMLYTSGSTGVPKGVMLEHKNIYAFCRYYITRFEFDHNARTTAYASYGFDASMWDTYPTLMSGATLYIIPEEMRLDLIKLGEFFDENEITHSFMTTQVGRQFAAEIKLKTLKYFFVGGEKLVPMEPPIGYKFYNAYGPTEGTVFCTTQIVDKLYHRIPIGKILDDYKCYILDKNKKPLPTLVTGELYISGPQVSRGYLNREKENQIAFLKNEFESDPKFERLYKTGDIVRMLPSGQIDFIGRKDGQVKIRGFRIELSEVEKVIRDYPTIKDATVKDFTDPSGVKYIVGYVVSNEKVNFEDLAKFIMDRKPPYMVPAYFMQLDKIPLNQNQKVNKRLLPEPKIELQEKIMPRNQEETDLYEIVKSILGHDEFGVTIDLFEAGLTSVSSIRFTILISKKFDKSISNKDLKDNSTIEALAKFLGAKQEDKVYEEKDFYPLSKTQEGIFVESVSKANSTNYNIPYLFKLSKDINIEKLKEAVVKVLNNHPYLRTTLSMDEDGNILAARKVADPVVTIIDGEIDKDKLVRPFSILNAPLYRVEIYLGKDNYLFFDFHHILCDGTSEAVILEDLSKAYKGEELQKEEFTGFEVALEEQDNLASEKLDEAKKYYHEVLKDIDGDYLLKKDLKTKKESKLLSTDYFLNIDNDKLDNFIKNNKLTNNAYFNFAFGFTLSKFIYKNDALYVTIYNGRNSSKLARTVSMLVKTLPVYFKYEEEDKVIDKLNETKSLLAGLEEHDIYSFADVAKDYDVSSDVMFAYQGDDFTFDNIGGHKVESILLESDTPKSPFSIDVFLEKGKFRVHYEIDEAIYNLDTVASFNRLFELVLNELLTAKLIKEINTLPEEDKKLYEKFNQTEQDIPNITFNEHLERNAREIPAKIAVIGVNREYSYKELNEAANKVAHALLDNDVKLEDRVVMFMPRIAEAYVVRQGIIKSGGAFVPVDPKYPDERVEYIITNSGAKVLISTKEILKDKGALIKSTNIKVLAIEDILESNKIDNPNVKINQNGLCYIIYTSGSTGKPKGVMISHRNLVNYVLDGDNYATGEYRMIDEEVVGCSFSSFAFDASLQEECVVLSHGYTAVIATEDEIQNPLLLAKTLKKYHVNIMFMTPSFVANLLDIDEFVDALKQFKVLDMGAEAVPTELCERLRSLGINAVLNNGYGPTETTITATMHKVVDEYMTIGKPLANIKAYLLDKAGHILPINAIGDLTLAGEAVGLGYLGLEEKTKEAFIQVNGVKTYRSGDLARYNSEGNIEFFGRKDNQVKLRGLRVELDEIEKVLNSYPNISRSIIVVKSSEVEGDYLAAYFTATQEINKEDLTNHMAKSLTPYMIPKVTMQLDKFPLTPNGKIDKKALPEVEVISEQKERKEATNDLERKLVKILAKALGKDTIGIDEDFFELGGTSLSASKVAMLALNAGLNISYGDVFEYPTVEMLEGHINGTSKEVVVQEEKEEIVSLKSLKYNDVKYIDEVTLGNDYSSYLLTGATGFLGIHILKELLDNKKHVYTLIRGGKLDPKSRLLGLLAYYFDDPLIDEVEQYVTVIDGDVTDETLIDKLIDKNFEIIINSAAIVKHFANDDIIERVNVGGVKNLIKVAKATNTRLIQISTLSVAGENIDNKFEDTFRMKENMLDFGQDVSNKYVHSKFNAEKAVLEAVEEGLDAKIIRVGNLMSRNSDGEFQANSITNGFMRDLKGYATLHKFPVNSMDIEVDLSPIDEVAKSILLLSRTPSKFTVFHSANSHMIQMGDIIYVMNELGFNIDIVSDEEFNKSMLEMMNDDSKSMLVSSLISYGSSDLHTHSFILSDNVFTNKALYHLSYKWPISDYKYLKNAIESLATLDFFRRTDL